MQEWVTELRICLMLLFQSYLGLIMMKNRIWGGKVRNPVVCSGSFRQAESYLAMANIPSSPARRDQLTMATNHELSARRDLARHGDVPVTFRQARNPSAMARETCNLSPGQLLSSPWRGVLCHNGTPSMLMRSVSHKTLREDP